MFLNILAMDVLPKKGRIHVLYSDRGSILISKLCQAYYEAMGIDNRAADAHMHTVVGICERFNTTLRELARAAWFDHRCQWDLYLQWALAFYNATVQASTGYSPFYLNNGRQFEFAWTPEEWSKLKTNLATSAQEYVQRHITTMHASWDVVQRALQQTEERRREAHDNKYQTNVKFDVGDLVLILQPGRRSKMDPLYRGPRTALWRGLTSSVEIAISLWIGVGSRSTTFSTLAVCGGIQRRLMEISRLTT